MKRKKFKGVLAEGEVTGHFHKLKSKVDVFETDEGTREAKFLKPLPKTLT